MKWPRSKKLLYMVLFFVMFWGSLHAHANNLAWIDNGWNQMEQGHSKQAIKLWQQGVNSLTDEQLLIQLGVYMRIGDAFHVLKKVGQKEHLIVLRASYNDELGYYVLSPRDVSNNTTLRHQQLASLREAAGINTKLYGNHAKKFKHIGTKQTQMISSDQVTERAGMLKEINNHSFEIHSFIMQGNALISTAAIQAQVKAFLGSGKIKKDLHAAGKAIENLYHSHGYNLKNLEMTINSRDNNILVSIVESPPALRVSIKPLKTQPAPPSPIKSTPHWTLNGKRSLKENLIDLTKLHQWTLVWEIPNDYQVGVDVRLSGSLDLIVEQIVKAYSMRGVLLKIKWFKGNKVMLVRRVHSEDELIQATK